MTDDKKQDRREFLISSVRNTMIGGLGLLGIGLGYKSINADPQKQCEVNLPCRNCFKLGNCAEDKAIKMRNDIKQDDLSAKQKNGKENG